MALPALWYPALCLTGVTAGFIDAIAGGGGLLTVPVLLATGLPTREALGANKFQSSSGTTLAAIHYARSGLLRDQALSWGLAATAAGAAAGAWAAAWAEERWLRPAVPVLLLTMVVYTWIRPSFGRQVRPARLPGPAFGLIFGLGLGFYDGFFGPGTGAFWTVSAVGLLGLDLLRATAYAKAMNLTSNLVALGVFAAAGSVPIAPAGVMAAGQMLGGHWGARAATRGGHRLIRPLFLAVATTLTLKLGWNAFRPQARPIKAASAEVRPPSYGRSHTPTNAAP